MEIISLHLDYKISFLKSLTVKIEYLQIVTYHIIEHFSMLQSSLTIRWLNSHVQTLHQNRK